MIKWGLFWKSLKQLFIISLISCFILLGNSFVNAFPDLISVVPWTSFTWINEGGLIIEPFDLSTNLTFSKPVVYSNFTWLVNYSFYWDIDWYLHFYNKNQYWRSDYTITGYNLVLSWQNTILSQTWMVEYVNNHFNDIVSLDFYFGYSCQNSYNYWTTFSINFDTWFIYFAGGLCQWNNLYVNPWWWPKQSPTDLTIAWLHTYNSPFSSVWGLWGSVYNSWFDNILTWDYVYTSCTNWEIIDELENAWFNKYMCYWWLDNFNLYDSSLNYSPIPWTWKSLNQILSNAISIQWAWDTPSEWFQFWDWLYQNRYINSYNAMWESYPAVYRTWFDIYYQYWRNLNKDFDWVREYCLMTVGFNLDKNAVYKWQFFKGVCDTVIDKKINSSYYVGSWNSVIWTNWDWVGNLSNSGLNDPVKFIQDYFNIAKQNIPTRYDLWGGFLPLYIITFMCALILFRFLSH